MGTHLGNSCAGGAHGLVIELAARLREPPAKVQAATSQLKSEGAKLLVVGTSGIFVFVLAAYKAS